MAKNSTPTRSNKKLYKAYFKRKNENSLFSIFFVPFREIGMFLLPLPIAYLLFYYLVFEGGGKENGMRGIYAILLVSILAVDIAAYYLRKMWREHKFRKYSEMEVPTFEKNRWTCPHCGNGNNLLSPCQKCGIYPKLYKSDKKEAPTPKTEKKSRRRKEQQEFDQYVPQFK